MINKSTELVIDKICRSCMCQDENMRNLFDSKELGGQTLQLAEILMDCASVVVSRPAARPRQPHPSNSRLSQGTAFQTCCA
jgi:hypothetical protein